MNNLVFGVDKIPKICSTLRDFIKTVDFPVLLDLAIFPCVFMILSLRYLMSNRQLNYLRNYQTPKNCAQILT